MKLSRRASELVGEFCFSDFFPHLGWMDIVTGLVKRLRETAEGLDAFQGMSKLARQNCVNNAGVGDGTPYQNPTKISKAQEEVAHSSPFPVSSRIDPEYQAGRTRNGLGKEEGKGGRGELEQSTEEKNREWVGQGGDSDSNVILCIGTPGSLRGNQESCRVRGDVGSWGRISSYGVLVIHPCIEDGDLPLGYGLRHLRGSLGVSIHVFTRGVTPSGGSRHKLNLS
ncbi:unnamed protein product [Thlaspi arvense]|uniref:Uncharacterized protein n=1 Tax=Thlaspi arvense TaxID=13288 RepID=A0AAU9S7Q3_THLAR|nr:unnamed protein product [Thlaspi arvense]